MKVTFDTSSASLLPYFYKLESAFIREKHTNTHIHTMPTQTHFHLCDLISSELNYLKHYYLWSLL